MDLSFNRINRVEKGAFQGQFLVISFFNNRLTQFEADVFQSVLQVMSEDSRSDGINIDRSKLNEINYFIFYYLSFSMKTYRSY